MKENSLDMIPCPPLFRSPGVTEVKWPGAAGMNAACFDEALWTSRAAAGLGLTSGWVYTRASELLQLSVQGRLKSA